MRNVKKSQIMFSLRLLTGPVQVVIIEVAMYLWLFSSLFHSEFVCILLSKFVTSMFVTLCRLLLSAFKKKNSSRTCPSWLSSWGCFQVVFFFFIVSRAGGQMGK